jgi:simple sugar transport system permease protein
MSEKQRAPKPAKSATKSLAVAVAADSAEARSGERVARLRAVIFGVFAALTLSSALSSTATAHFSFWVDKIGGQDVAVSFPIVIAWALAGVALAVTAVLQFRGGASFRWRRALGVVLPIWIIAIFSALLNGTPANLTVLFTATFNYAAPVAIGALAGIISERSGVLNIAIEGNFLIGALVGAVASSLVGIAIAGPIAGAIMGALVGLLLAVLGLRYKVDQIVAGTVINIGAAGITNFLYLRVLQTHAEFNQPQNITSMELPLLSSIPVIGHIFFSLNPYFYLAVALVAFFSFMIFKTRWGLRLRASGEQPSAAGTVGVDVIKLRYRAVVIAGALAGLGGSYLSLSGTGGFGMGISSGKGFIALAALIFGAWNPVYAFGAALIFGFAEAASTLLAILGVGLPPQLLLAVPYIVTIVVVAGLIGRVRGPASAGRPYEQG